MKLSQFKFEIDLKLIPKVPKPNRDDSRLMVVHHDTGKIEHRQFRDILEYFSDEDVMVVNNTKVFPARLYGKKEKTGANIEVFLLRELDKNNKLWDVIVEPARKIRVGNKLYFGDNEDMVAEVIDNTTSRGRTIKFMYSGSEEEFRNALFALGETPIPKFFDRKPTELDDERYQTVYAKREGSVAAPTAGMHFSRELIKRLEIEGVRFTEVTLHTGLSSFRPIEVEDLSKHKMDAEYFQIYDHTCEVVNRGKELNKKICAIGTTTLRALESSVTAKGLLKPQESWTNMFIHPPYEFEIANCLLTNFHLPKTSLQVNVAAFAGFELAQEAYEIAKKEKYGFFTFGDAMLIL